MSDKRIFAVIFYGQTRNEIGSIHRDGCRDIDRDRRDHGGSVHRVRCYTVKGALNFAIDSEMVEMGYTHNDMHVLPCTA